MLTIVSGVTLRNGLFTVIMLINLAFDKPARATRHVTKLQRLRDEHVTGIHSPRDAAALNRPEVSWSQSIVSDTPRAFQVTHIQLELLL
jgi:hypothetical protein